MCGTDTVLHPARRLQAGREPLGSIITPRLRKFGVAANAGARPTTRDMGGLGPLPPIDVSMDQKPPKEASRSAESQADLVLELDLLHRELGVKRGVPSRLGYAFVVVLPLLTCTWPVLSRSNHRRRAQGGDEAEARVPDAEG